jgi:subtilisin family serine protease
MKRSLFAALLLLAPLLYAGDEQYRYIVATRAAAPVAVQRILTDDLSPRNDRDIQAWDLVDAFAANLTDDEVTKLKGSKHVLYVEPVVERYLMALPARVTPNSDSIQPGREIIPYGVDMVNGPSVWAVSRGAGKNGTPTHVAIIDTGIDYNHPELRRAFKTGIDLVNNDNDPLDDEGHGTHVAGIIAAAVDGQGVVGVAPDVDIYSVKVLSNCGSTPRTTNDVLITAIQWVVNEKKTIGGNWVVNMSLGGPDFSSSESAAFQAAADAGILIFASAGNGFDPTSPSFVIAYPAAYSSVVAVGAVDSTETVASFSQRGPELRLVAPGVDVLSSLIASDLTTSNGKTFAAELGVASTADGTDLCLASQHFSGPFVFCGFGGSASEFPASVAGKIALISRGNSVNFSTKMANAKAANATGGVVFNNQGDGLVTMALGTATSASAVLPMLFIGQSDGQALLASNATVSSGFGFETYANFDGTSMSSPHAAACAALVRSRRPRPAPLCSMPCSPPHTTLAIPESIRLTVTGSSMPMRLPSSSRRRSSRRRP